MKIIKKIPHTGRWYRMTFVDFYRGQGRAPFRKPMTWSEGRVRIIKVYRPIVDAYPRFEYITFNGRRRCACLWGKDWYRRFTVSPLRAARKR